MKQLWYIISKCDKIEIEKCEGWLCRLYIAYNYLVLNVCSVHGEKVVILHHPPSCSFPPIGFYPAMCNVHVVACVTIFENDLSLQTAFYTLHIHPWKNILDENIHRPSKITKIGDAGDIIDTLIANVWNNSSK